ncbi:hypothetical protein [Chitinophaga barathri]|uniref:Uncharacterized protein n=1 Tax=Chitinophaga barathri TaxID=1647451 RepID=A0A3N4MCT3_9BACT|nr:hypothetical protein [Chitinophaga barathri]RPD39347.1 hypothetical protein EG028_19675 [Chitinophaga barathri]
MKKEKISSAEEEFALWKAQHERLQKMFTAQALSSRNYLRRRIDLLRDIERRYGNVSENGSRLAVTAISAERRLLENGLYKSKILRAVLNVFSVLKLFFTERRQLKGTDSVFSTGAADSRSSPDAPRVSAVSALSASRSKSASALDDHKISEGETAKVNMTFDKDQSGYSYKSYKVRHLTTDGGVKEHSFRIPDGMIVSSQQAYNLVCGRSCQTRDGSWLSLDINDKDKNGNYPLKVYGKDHGFDLSEALKGEPIKETKDEVDRRRLISDLQKGEPVSATYLQNGKEKTISLEASPKMKTVRKLGVNERMAKNKKTAKVVKMHRGKSSNMRG